MNNPNSDITPPTPVKLSTDSPPLLLDTSQTLDRWLSSLPEWLRPLINLTPAQRKQRLDDLGWYGAPEGYGIPKLRRKLIRGDWAALKADHEAQVRAQIRLQQANRPQFELLPSAKTSVPCDPVSRTPSKAEAQAFAKIWAEIDAGTAAEEAQAATVTAQVAADRAKAEEYGFSYPVDTTQGVPFEEALAWTVGCAGFHRRGYKDVTKFRAWLQRAEYPYLDIGRITPKGFALVLQRERARASKYQTAWRRAPLEEFTNQDSKAANRCLECGQFLAQPENLRRRNARYCSAKCKQTAYRKRHRYG
jgi:hypothetical protein